MSAETYTTQDGTTTTEHVFVGGNRVVLRSRVSLKTANAIISQNA
jgi:hypothetical protein